MAAKFPGDPGIGVLSEFQGSDVLAPGRPSGNTCAGKTPKNLTPSMALRDGKGYLAYGTPGGDQQDQWQTIFLLRHLVGDMNLQEAIDAPSFHTEHFPESFFPRKANPGNWFWNPVLKKQ